MKLPSKIKIGPYRYNIKIERDLKNDKDEILYGQCSSMKHLIQIAADLPKEREKAVAIHEVLHALWEITSLKEKEHEETVVMALTPLLLGLIRDNPKLMEYLSE